MLFLELDVETDDEGEILVEQGDLKLADSERTAIQSANFIVLTDFGDYTPEPAIAANLGEFIGHPNSARTHNLMLQNIHEAFRLQNLFLARAIKVVVSPIAVDEAGVVLKLLADFGQTAEEDSYGSPVLAFKFPYPNGQIEKVSVDTWV